MTQINYSFCTLPLGEALIASDGEGICYLSFIDDQSEECMAEMKRTFRTQEVAYCQCEDHLIKEAVDQLSNWSAKSYVKLSVRGTAFQQKVWEQLLKIPFGKTSTYQEIASSMGTPNAARAVANAIGKNHIAMFIPCHRVIRTDGSLAGFRWGIERKKALLDSEGLI